MECPAERQDKGSSGGAASQQEDATAPSAGQLSLREAKAKAEFEKQQLRKKFRMFIGVLMQLSVANWTISFPLVSPFAAERHIGECGWGVGKSGHESGPRGELKYFNCCETCIIISHVF